MAQDTFIKRELKAKGWSARKASLIFKVHPMHMYKVANNYRQSKRLEKMTEQLPKYDDFIRRFPNFFENHKTLKK